jgi:hypothetical protein
MPTIESNIHSIADSLKVIADCLTILTANKTVPNATTPQVPTIVQAPTPAPVQVAAPVAAIPVPMVAPAPVAVPAPPVAAMPALPTFEVAASLASPTLAVAAPFADKQAMMDFVLSSYKALGTEKGAKIQDVLTGLGFRNINDAPPENWGALKAGIDALKG